MTAPAISRNTQQWDRKSRLIAVTGSATGYFAYDGNAERFAQKLKRRDEEVAKSNDFLSPSLWGSFSIEQMPLEDNRNFDQCVLADNAIYRRDA